ncbi:MAG: glycosyl transferase [bacterium]|nr:glycosyl transferase [Candidatus Limimorpha caballi]
MIPLKIHYCWFGRGEMPQIANDCIASWHKYMPNWEYKLWDEENFDINCNQYVKEAYKAGKYAFVSDYVRLKALHDEGGLYMDVDFMVYKPFDDLMHLKAFAGFEGSKHHPVMMGVIASEAGGMWVKEQLDSYKGRLFFKADGSFDMTTNVTFVTSNMSRNGLVQNGIEQDYKDLHIFPVDYFCPFQTTGEYFRTENTYCESVGEAPVGKGWKSLLRKLIGPNNMIRLIKLKRRITKNLRNVVVSWKSGSSE